jgi:hypothetical protein
MAAPEAAVDEDDLAPRFANQIRETQQIARVDTTSVPKFKDETAND